MNRGRAGSVGGAQGKDRGLGQGEVAIEDLFAAGWEDGCPILRVQGRHVWLQRGRVPAADPAIEGMRNVQRLLKTQNPRIADVNIEDLVDNRFIRKLDDSGFFEKIYGK